MRRVKIQPEAVKMLLQPRGKYHVSLALMYNVEKILFPEKVTDIYLAGIRLGCVEIPDDRIPLKESEYAMLNTRISRNGKTLADVMELGSELVCETGSDGKPLTYIRYDKQSDRFRKAAVLYLSHRYVTDIDFIETDRGDIYIVCKINGIQQEALRIKRTQSRNLDRYETDVYHHYAAMYYYEKLIKFIY